MFLIPALMFSSCKDDDKSDGDPLLAPRNLVGLAGDGQVHGLFQCAADHCKSISPNVRVDTHANNTTMQRLIEKSGFKECGIIHVRDGSPRIAYHWTAR